MEGRNVGTIKRESHKQGLTSAKDLTIELPEGHHNNVRVELNQSVTVATTSSQDC